MQKEVRVIKLNGTGVRFISAKLAENQALLKRNGYMIADANYEETTIVAKEDLRVEDASYFNDGVVLDFDNNPKVIKEVKQKKEKKPTLKK